MSDAAPGGSGPRALPAVHALLEHPALAAVTASCGREIVAAAVREVLDSARADALAGMLVPRAEALAASAAGLVRGWTDEQPRPVINAGGVIVNTNLGRAPVSAAAAEAMRRAAAGYSALEYSLEAGERGSRHDLVAPLVRRLTGADAALVVNNNAGALLLVLSALAAGREVVVSRGQLVEIGGGFRIPEIMAAGGARLLEVGTTNRTHAADYRAALERGPALLLRVHSSNFRMSGFVAEVGLPELVALGREAGVPVVDDLGSGSLLDTSAFGLEPEPVVGASLRAGADLVTFSGDKLLGGPQAGIIVGRSDLVATLRRHPMTRALRPGKTVLAGLHQTLLHYARGEAPDCVPVWRMIAASGESISARAEAWRSRLEARGISCRLVAGASTVGGGALPGATLPTTLVVVDDARPSALAAALRGGRPAVIGRVESDGVALDPRTVLPEEDDLLLEAVARGRGA